MSKKWIVVGISGATCGGKTTLANKLHEYFPGSVKIAQDDYFYPTDSPHHVKCEALGHLNWELMSALDMKSMRSDINTILSQDPSLSCLPSKATRSVKSQNNSDAQFRNILILEGFLLLNDHEISVLCDLRYFLVLTREECWARRCKRAYDPPDIPGYFDLVVWPEYVKNRDEVIRNANVNVIDGIVAIDESIKDLTLAIENQIMLKNI